MNQDQKEINNQSQNSTNPKDLKINVVNYKYLSQTAPITNTSSSYVLSNLDSSDSTAISQQKFSIFFEEFELMKIKINYMTNDLKKLRLEHDQLREDHDQLLYDYKDLSQEHESLNKNLIK